MIESTLSAGPLPLNENLVGRYNTSLNTGLTMTTDDNCFTLVNRHYTTETTQVVAGNYYPVTCAAFLV